MKFDIIPLMLLALAPSATAVCDVDGQTAAMAAVKASDSSLQNGPTDCAGVDTFIGAMVGAGCTEDSYVLDESTGALFTTTTWGSECSQTATALGCPEKCDQLPSGPAVCNAANQHAAMAAVISSDSSLADGPTDCASVDTFMGALAGVGCTEDSYMLDDVDDQGDDHAISTTTTWGAFCSLAAADLGPCPASTCDRVAAAAGVCNAADQNAAFTTVISSQSSAAVILTELKLSNIQSSQDGPTDCYDVDTFIGALVSAGCTEDSYALQHALDDSTDMQAISTTTWGSMCSQLAADYGCPESCDFSDDGLGCRKVMQAWLDADGQSCDVCDADGAAMAAVISSDPSLADGPTDCAGVDTFMGAMVAVGCTEDSYVAGDEAYTWGYYCSIFADMWGCPASTCDQLQPPCGAARQITAMTTLGAAAAPTDCAGVTTYCDAMVDAGCTADSYMTEGLTLSTTTTWGETGAVYTALYSCPSGTCALASGAASVKLAGLAIVGTIAAAAMLV